MAEKFDNIGVRTEDIDKLFSLLNTKDPFVFEIWCANGRGAKEMVNRTDRYLGVDISEGLIEIARNNNPEGKFKVADAEMVSFPENINAVVAFASLLYVDINGLKKVLQKAHDALNHKGIVYISLKEGEYSESGHTKADQFGTRTYYFYTPETVKRVAGDRFGTIEVEKYNCKDQDWFTIILQKAEI